MLLPKFIKVQDLDQIDHSINIDSIAMVSESAVDQTAYVYLKQSVNGSSLAIRTLDSHDAIMDAIEEAKKTDVFTQ